MSKKIFKFILSTLLIASIISIDTLSAPYSGIQALESTVELGLSAGAACLMDGKSGEILYEKNSHEKFEPASVTKIMSLLLAMEALDNGSIALDTKITGSMRASEMGGSQIWLEYGEEMTFDEMLKSIIVVSANDCTVAVAEHLAGSEEAFVQRMNERAKELGMNDTTFKNSTGLPEEGHVTSANDIAIMTRELSKHKTVFNYTTIWLDSVRNGQMGLSNTNKLIRFYNGATGMKTGFTSSAKYCLSATASREEMDLIAVVLKCETSDERFENAKKMLDYGFANFTTFTSIVKQLDDMKVKGGQNTSVKVKYLPISVLLTKNKKGKVEETVNLPDYIKAPMKAGDEIGNVTYSVDGEIIGKAPIILVEDVASTNFIDIISKIFKKLIMLK